jgi:hypothetical protein
MPPFLEPFRIKSVEPMPFPTAAARRDAPAAAGHNLIRAPARVVTIDLLTGSGAAAMSAAQRSALPSAGESGARCFERCQSVVRERAPPREILPVQAGRLAERILLRAILRREGVGEQYLFRRHQGGGRGGRSRGGGPAGARAGRDAEPVRRRYRSRRAGGFADRAHGEQDPLRGPDHHERREWRSARIAPRRAAGAAAGRLPRGVRGRRPPARSSPAAPVARDHAGH